MSCGLTCTGGAGDDEGDDDDERNDNPAAVAAMHANDPIKKKYQKKNRGPREAVEWRAEFALEEKEKDKRVFMTLLNPRVSAEFG